MKLELKNNLDISRYEYANSTISRLLSEAPSNVVIDAGAGTGEGDVGREAIGSFIQRIGGVWMPYDINPKRENISYWNLDTPLNDRFKRGGIVLLLDVIEHLKNPGLALKNISDALLEGGYLLVTTPNLRWSRSRLFALLTGYPAMFTESDLSLNGHKFPLWPHVMHELLKEAGFEVMDYVTLDGKTSWPGRPVTIRYPLRLGVTLLNKFIEKLDKTACGESYAMLAKKRAG